MRLLAGNLLRTFICVKLPESHIEKLRRWISSARRECGEVRWVRPETIHITLKFCGEITAEVAEAMSGLLRAAKLGGAFSLSVSGIGGFPSIERPRVLWTGIEGDKASLAKLAASADRCAVRCGAAPERRGFAPHITLGRRDAITPLDAALIERWLAEPPKLEPWRVDELIFMRSELRPEGPRYTPLERYHL